jgi:hypothetical protein
MVMMTVVGLIVEMEVQMVEVVVMVMVIMGW